MAKDAAAPAATNGSKTKPQADTASKKAKRHLPSFVNHVLVPLAAAPLLFAGLVFLSRTVGPKLFASSEERPAFITLPYFGGSLGPAMLGLTIYLFRIKFLSFLGFLRVPLILLPGLVLLAHNFFTVLYGNINNDAWSDTIMIDVIGPPGTFKPFLRIPDDFALATDAGTWAQPDVLDGPHLDVSAVHSASCGPRSFARFMYHRILPSARVHKLLLGDHVIFGGIWVMVAGTDPRRCVCVRCVCT